MTKEKITYLLWSDLVGVTRTRGIPSQDLDSKLDSGVGWASSGQALSAFGHIVDNPWGPMDEARQIPDPSALFEYQSAVKDSSWSAVICDSKKSKDVEWDCCARTFYKRALAELYEETGLTIAVGFEHEFLLQSDQTPRLGFTLSAALQQNDFLQACSAALRKAGITPETLEPENGLGQYEVSCGPKIGVAGADAALITREVIRAVASDFGLKVSFSPKPEVNAVANGAHLHFSLVNQDGLNVTYDEHHALGLSQQAQYFCAGILAHLDALTAITAPTPVSYYRIKPNIWSCGYKSIGLQNREAALRIVPSVASDPKRRAQGFNIEYRPVDATASPYLTLGVLVLAGLHGIRHQTALPKPIDFDPATRSKEQLEAHGITALPNSLENALKCLQHNDVVRSWFSPTLFDTYIKLKTWEHEQAQQNEESELLQRYSNVY